MHSESTAPWLQKETGGLNQTFSTFMPVDKESFTNNTLAVKVNRNNMHDLILTEWTPILATQDSFIV